MQTRLVTLIFAVLLVGMQQHAPVHALAHLDEVQRRPHEPTLQLPADDFPCAVCALYAGGSSAATAGSAAIAGPARSFAAPIGVERTVAASRPAYYRSRAPPLPA